MLSILIFVSVVFSSPLWAEDICDRDTLEALIDKKLCLGSLSPAACGGVIASMGGTVFAAKLFGTDSSPKDAAFKKFKTEFDLVRQELTEAKKNILQAEYDWKESDKKLKALRGQNEMQRRRTDYTGSLKDAEKDASEKFSKWEKLRTQITAAEDKLTRFRAGEGVVPGADADGVRDLRKRIKAYEDSAYSYDHHRNEYEKMKRKGEADIFEKEVLPASRKALVAAEEALEKAVNASPEERAHLKRDVERARMKLALDNKAYRIRREYEEQGDNQRRLRALRAKMVESEDALRQKFREFRGAARLPLRKAVGGASVAGAAGSALVMLTADERVPHACYLQRGKLTGIEPYARLTENCQVELVLENLVELKTKPAEERQEICAKNPALRKLLSQASQKADQGIKAGTPEVQDIDCRGREAQVRVRIDGRIYTHDIKPPVITAGFQGDETKKRLGRLSEFNIYLTRDHSLSHIASANPNFDTVGVERLSNGALAQEWADSGYELKHFGDADQVHMVQQYRQRDLAHLAAAQMLATKLYLPQVMQVCGLMESAGPAPKSSGPASTTDR